MKTFLVGLIALVGITITNSANAQPGFRANVSFNDFYHELSPYGRWMTMPRYGQVWIYNEPGFRPYYTNGQWMDTDLGYSWSSNYDWGWAPFHYGRWEFDPAYGWFWIPGYEYAPAWVLWSQADDYYGWAPLGFGVDINISIGRIPSNRWMYAPCGYIGYSRIDRYCVPYNRVNVYYNRQRPVTNVYVYNNVHYDRGPGRNFNNNRHDNYRYNNGSRPDRRPEYNNNYGNRPDRRPEYNSNNRPNNAPENRPQNNPRSNNIFENRRPETNNDRPEIVTRPQATRPDMTNRNYNEGRQRQDIPNRNYNQDREVTRERIPSQNNQPRPVERTQPSRMYRMESNSSNRSSVNMRSADRNLRTNRAEARR